MISLCFHIGPSWGSIDAYPFPDEQLRDRYHGLIAELRCPQCLNTNLAGSDAMIAQDLRREVHRMLIEGHSDDEIISFMYERYGDFVLYKPRFNGRTALLWLTPVLLLALGSLVFWRVVRTGTKSTSHQRSAADDKRLQQLLSDR
ncbi:MAG: cytochrome c-type biogenesis protein [Pseudomonadota bacterium]